MKKFRKLRKRATGFVLAVLSMVFVLSLSTTAAKANYTLEEAIDGNVKKVILDNDGTQDLTEWQDVVKKHSNIKIVIKNGTAELTEDELENWLHFSGLYNIGIRSVYYVNGSSWDSTNYIVKPLTSNSSSTSDSQSTSQSMNDTSMQHIEDILDQNSHVFDEAGKVLVGATSNALEIARNVCLGIGILSLLLAIIRSKNNKAQGKTDIVSACLIIASILGLMGGVALIAKLATSVSDSVK